MSMTVCTVFKCFLLLKSLSVFYPLFFQKPTMIDMWKNQLSLSLSLSLSLVIFNRFSGNFEKLTIRKISYDSWKNRLARFTIVQGSDVRTFNVARTIEFQNCAPLSGVSLSRNDFTVSFVSYCLDRTIGLFSHAHKASLVCSFTFSQFCISLYVFRKSNFPKVSRSKFSWSTTYELLIHKSTRLNISKYQETKLSKHFRLLIDSGVTDRYCT